MKNNDMCVCGHEEEKHTGEIVKMTCLYYPFDCSCVKFSLAKEKPEAQSHIGGTYSVQASGVADHIARPSKMVAEAEDWEKKFDELSHKLITQTPRGLCVLLDYPPHDRVLDEKEVKTFIRSLIRRIRQKSKTKRPAKSGA